MLRSFDRAGLLEALDAIGAAAFAYGTRLDLAIYGGSALMLAGNFRFATEDVDIAEIGVRPDWLDAIVAEIAEQRGWSADWLNEAVAVHLSALANAASDHVEYGTFPRGGPVGLQIIVPTADYMLALKLKAMRTLDAAKGAKETDDIFQLMRVTGIDTADAAMQILARYFPVSARSPCPSDVMAGLVPAIHAGTSQEQSSACSSGGAWMAGTRPAMTAPSDEARTSIDAPIYAGRGVPPRTGG